MEEVELHGPVWSMSDLRRSPMSPNPRHGEGVQTAVLAEEVPPTRLRCGVLAFDTVHHGLVSTDRTGAFGHNHWAAVDLQRRE